MELRRHENQRGLQPTSDALAPSTARSPVRSILVWRKEIQFEVPNRTGSPDESKRTGFVHSKCSFRISCALISSIHLAFLFENIKGEMPEDLKKTGVLFAVARGFQRGLATNLKRKK